MKNVFIDFKEQYEKYDLTLGDNYIYGSEYNRLILRKVTEVIYENNNIIITYYYLNNKRIKHIETIDLNLVKKLVING